MSKPKTAILDSECVWSPDMDAAALQVLRKLPPSKRELAGAIYARKGPEALAEFCYSIPVEGDDSNFSLATEKGRNFVGIYHTHPGGGDDELFSANDVDVANQLKRPSYIRADDSGEVRRYDSTTPETAPALRKKGMASGTLVGTAPTRRDQLVAAFDKLSKEGEK